MSPIPIKTKKPTKIRGSYSSADHAGSVIHPGSRSSYMLAASPCNKCGKYHSGTEASTDISLGSSNLLDDTPVLTTANTSLDDIEEIEDSEVMNLIESPDNPEDNRLLLSTVEYPRYGALSSGIVVEEEIFDSQMPLLASQDLSNDTQSSAEMTAYTENHSFGIESESPMSSSDFFAHPHKDYTTKLYELTILVRTSLPLIITFLLQNSLSVASVFSVGHLGKKELAGITLGSMTANITGFAAIQGLATCLDTLCCQAYGAKKYHLVGIYLQRCIAMILTLFIPICLFWFFGAKSVLKKILPKSSNPEGPQDDELIDLAVNYLKVVSLGIPGYAIFECGKRFLQSQCVFHASTYILLICAPINMLLNYFLVWNKTFGIGYLGAPLSVAIVDWLMAFGLIFYTVTTKHPANVMKCWGGLNITLSFKHWDRLLNLAFNGLIMVWAEFLAFEILTIFSSYLGIIALDANSVVSSITALSYQIPFAVSIAGSTRLANLVGASLPNSAKKSANVTLFLGFFVAVFNCLTMYFARSLIAMLFTSDKDVIAKVEDILKIIAVMQIFDSINAITNGLLRGEGRQHIGSVTNIFSYYVVGLPLAYSLTFHLHYDLYGLWIGTAIGLCCISITQTYYSVIHVNWTSIISEAHSRNERERNL